jgi:hypothetical protein
MANKSPDFTGLSKKRLDCICPTPSAKFLVMKLAKKQSHLQA